MNVHRHRNDLLVFLFPGFSQHKEHESFVLLADPAHQPPFAFHVVDDLGNAGIGKPYVFAYLTGCMGVTAAKQAQHHSLIDRQAIFLVKRFFERIERMIHILDFADLVFHKRITFYAKIGEIFHIAKYFSYLFWKNSNGQRSTQQMSL